MSTNNGKTMFTTLAVLLRIAVNPLSNVFQKVLCSKGQSPFVTGFLTYALLSLAGIPFALVIPWSTFPLSFWCYSALVGLFGALGNGFLIKAMQRGELSVLGPVNSWKSIVGILFGMILLHEFPDLVGLSGVLLIMVGSYFILAPNPSSEPFSWRVFGRPDMLYRLSAMVLAAIEAVFLKKVILLSNANVAMLVWCWGGLLFSIPLVLADKTISWRSERATALSGSGLLLALAFSVGLMQWSTNYVFAHMPVGYALALFQLSSVLSVLYGRLIFHETGIMRKLIASAVMVAGSALVILGG